MTWLAVFAQLSDNQWLNALLGPGGLLVALILVVLTGVREDWVFGKTYRRDREYLLAEVIRERRDAEMYRDALFSSVTAAEKAGDALQKVTLRADEERTLKAAAELLRQKGLA